MLLIVLIGNVVQVPYLLCSRCEGTFSAVLGVFYLLLVSFSPCIYVEAMSYHPAFPLLVSHCPMLLGLFGFVVEYAKIFIWRLQREPEHNYMQIAPTVDMPQFYSQGVGPPMYSPMLS